jgi:hypothetical protein
MRFRRCWPQLIGQRLMAVVITRSSRRCLILAQGFRKSSLCVCLMSASRPRRTFACWQGTQGTCLPIVAANSRNSSCADGRKRQLPAARRSTVPQPSWLPPHPVRRPIHPQQTLRRSSRGKTRIGEQTPAPSQHASQHRGTPAASRGRHPYNQPVAWARQCHHNQPLCHHRS